MADYHKRISKVIHIMAVIGVLKKEVAWGVLRDWTRYL